MKIELMFKPESPTGFKAGDKAGYERSDTRLLVVGEDDLFLHTFIIETGEYWGVSKTHTGNIESLIKFST